MRTNSAVALLTSTTTVPIYGKLADIYGRKPLFLFGSTLFLLGSILCGAAQSTEQLIIFRAIQGLGAGAVLPIVLTIIGDIFDLKERAKFQGLFSGVWGLSSIVGPALGGIIVDHFSWRWVFYINIPLGTSLPFIVVSMFITGTGLGFASTAFILSVQNAVPWKLRGVATASTQFTRTIGGTIGVAAMGTILNAQMAFRFPPIFAHFASIAAHLLKNVTPANVLLTPDVRASLPAAFLHQLQFQFAQSLFWVFALMALLALLALATMFLLPGGRADQYSYKTQETTNETDDHVSEGASSLDTLSV